MWVESEHPDTADEGIRGSSVERDAAGEEEPFLAGFWQSSMCTCAGSEMMLLETIQGGNNKKTEFPSK